MIEPAVSVVIRAKDEAESIGRTLELLGSQTVPAEVVVVDSGSSDDTVAIARDHGAQIVEIPAVSFTFGGALNTGTAAARAEVVVALSAHAFPLDDGWLERMLLAMADDSVACASGQLRAPDGGPLEEEVVQDIALAQAHPMWGYSSHAGAFRRSLWEQRAFRTDMTASEDKEWAWHWMERGYVVVLGPTLGVAHSHHGDRPLSQFDRAYREWSWVGAFADLEPQPIGVVLSRWWNEREGRSSALRARLARKRIARLAGEYLGRRKARRRRSGA